jgi:hypothetical protein
MLLELMEAGNIPRYISRDVTGTDEMIYLGTYLEMLMELMG